ncbi:hypothetical protein [Granulicella arctica]|uniref:hypothetical protein n=1 Tax=Granulicella arctica TaxID=940613 RepID=UPI0021E05357|nr:hypothetical protein [Granulicella arctica]
MLKLVLTLTILTLGLVAQSVQPVIVEYKGRADGKFAITNDTLSPMVAVLEPRSFSITPDGKGIFRTLDSGIHVQLSSMSVKLQPKQTYYIFYKATADKLPAWFTVYTNFSPEHHSDGLDVHIMLPHTIYLYQKQPLMESDVEVRDVAYKPNIKKLTCNIKNNGLALARVQLVSATGVRSSGELAGFPLLPGADRHISMDWKDAAPPSQIDFHFEHFNLKRSVNTP